MSNTKIGQEIERRFICRIVGPVPDRVDRDRIEQVYLSTGDPQVRIRRIGDRFVQTVKTRSTKFEIEFTLPDDAGRAMFDVAITAPVVKTRYVVGPWEVDVFEGRFAGLVFLEIEDPPAVLPPVPDWLECVAETDVGNVSLATMSAARIADLIARSR